MDKIYYFAYGSNLHPARLLQRTPSAIFVGTARYPNHRLAFHKKGKDGSGKCNMIRSTEASDAVNGAIYQLHIADQPRLDQFEGKGYTAETIRIHANECELDCFTYLAEPAYITNTLKPYHWYKQLVILGAQYLQFPDTYITAIEAVESREDPDATRRSLHSQLIDSINRY